jgi:hypothetical protein
MATATLDSQAAPVARRGEYECQCGHLLRAFGSGRHRVFFQPDARLDDPVMNGSCPSCRRPLPGKNQS